MREQDFGGRVAHVGHVRYRGPAPLPVIDGGALESAH